MRKGVIGSLVVALGLVLVSSVYAYVPGGNPGGCAFRMARSGSEDFRNYQKTILPLRDELFNKKAELRREFSKTTLDRDRIAGIQKEIIDIRTEILKKTDEAGLPAWKGDRRRCGVVGKGVLQKRCPRPIVF